VIYDDIIRSMIYLDNNASTPVDPEVSDTVFSCLKRDFGNPSSSHMQGRRAKEVLETSRRQIAELLGCLPDEIYFTSGGTESNNLAILGTGMLRKSGHIITSAMEHPSVINPAGYLESCGFEVTYVSSDLTGRVNVEEISASIRKDTVLMSIMHSNNETGVIQPVDEIGALAEKHSVRFHVDAAQTVGKSAFDLNSFSVDMVTLVPHKFYGPKGIGALYVKDGCKLSPLMFGAGHEMGLRPGTENIPGIAGFAKACQLIMADLKLRIAHTSRLTESLFSKLRIGIPDIVLNGDADRKLPNTLNIRIPGISSDELVNKLSGEVAVSSGSACHSGKQKPSRVLKAMGLSDDEALSSIRLSVGKDNTAYEIDKAAELIIKAALELVSQNRKSTAEV
jgi:cysteine desulfurase